MNKEEMKEKMEKLNEKMKRLGEKAKDTMDTAYIVGLEAQDKLDEAVQETKSGINALKENYSIYSQKVKGKASAELLKAQMNFDVARTELEIKKVMKDREKLEKYIEETLEYSESCLNLSELAAEEAKLSKLEAVKAQKEYEEKYGKME